MGDRARAFRVVIAASCVLATLVVGVVDAAKDPAWRRNAAPALQEAEVLLDGDALYAHEFNNDSDDGNLTYDYDAARDTYFFCTASYCPVDSNRAWDSGRKFAVHPNMTNVFVYNTTLDFFWGLQKAPLLFYVGFDAATGHTVLTFEGTVSSSISSWVNDFRYYMVEPYAGWGWPFDRKVLVEGGFAAGWDKLRDIVYNATIDVLEQNAGSSLRLTGHSLGAALACMAAVDFELNGLRVAEVTTFGSPRVGNLDWAYFYNEDIGLIDRTWRIVNDRDPVPHIPYTGVTFFRGYHHVGIEVWQKGYNYTQCNDVVPYAMW